MRTRRLLIGITGKKGAGKNALAAAIRSYCPGQAVEMAFAQPLKDAARIIFGLSHVQMHGSLKETVDERWGKSPRELLQLLGTEVARSIDEDVWVKSAGIQLRNTWGASDRTLVVVTDVRFLNEADFIKKHQGLLVRIQRGPQQMGLWEDPHQSEMELEDIVPDLIVHNDGSLADLSGAAARAFSLVSHLEKHRFSQTQTFSCAFAREIEQAGSEMRKRGQRTS
jgi:hypothetical protein